MSPASLTHALAMRRVSASAKKSTTRGVSPARFAAAANARPESATTRMDGASACELLGKTVGVAEVEIDSLLGFDHLIEHAGLGLVLYVADRGRSAAHGLPASARLGIVVDADAFDAGRRH